MRGRVAASIVLAAGLVLGTAGCNLIAPQATTKKYDSSDGVNGNVGVIGVRNAMFIVNDDDSAANLIVTLVNTSNKSHRVEIQSPNDSGSTSEYVTVEAQSSRKVGEAGHPSLVIRDFDTKPGALHKVFFQYGDQTGVQLRVPVLTNALEAYSTLTPSPKPTPTETPTPVETATDTPQPTDTPAPTNG
ncbi:hypothetical protein OSC27_14005 [Microbacterium sp. STN6]|uniref:hypothetical protein n=1 Tax=Microbacterium sp. STN6 TaxID=2995588 RepID=UPI0022608EF1|nr:hypothetical protein [Microbacterium sp. STN6]MCX7523387.1 hypothetical protein [Microbacterium sp. STN6]